MGIGRLIPYLVWDGIGLGGWGMRAVAVVVADELKKTEDAMVDTPYVIHAF